MVTRIRQVREEMGLNQRELAEKTHMPQSAICDLELGKRKPWKNAMRAVSIALGKDTSYLFPEE